MEAERFDQIVRELGAGLPRRGLLGWLLALLSGPLFFWHDDESVEAAGRRKRRKARRKHHQNRSKNKRKRRKERRRGKRRKRGKKIKNKRKRTTCRPGEACGEPGQVCQNDGSCACTPTSCPACRVCNAASGRCEPDLSAVGNPCGQPIQVCQPDGVCACPSSASECGGVCGCESGFICEEGVCQPCDVVFNGDSMESGRALQDLLDDAPTDAVRTIRVCPGRYQHTFAVKPGTEIVLIGAGDGPDEETSTILDAGGNGTTLTIEGVASLRGVRITGGNARLGGGIYNNGDLTLTECTISDNEADDMGGAIYYSANTVGRLQLFDCRVTRNRAADGGGLAIHNSPVLISGCTISMNHSDGIGPNRGDGGGIFNNQSQGEVLTILGTEISGNMANLNGGGIYHHDPVTGDPPGTIIFDSESSVINNQADSDDDGDGTGGGIFLESGVSGESVQLNGARVEGNSPNNCAGDPVDGCSQET